MRRCQRHAKFFGRQHHHHFFRLRALFEKLGMTSKRNTCVVNDAFMHGACDQRSKFTVQTAITRSRQRLHHVMPIFNR
ncbi:Uncharacterised protein [Shigella sonnei]|nr:Uncharacterised protein [Shigella sonnei]CSG35935.1 Uncharacterised protein [Shigella sonnei]